MARIDESPIFVTGTARSGATLLRQMLCAHPRIHLAHESAVYFHRSLAESSAGPSAWLPRYFDTFSFRWLGLAPRAVLDELPARPSREPDRDAVRAVLRACARRRGRARFGEKNPLDTLSLQRIFRDFADPRVVHVVRDPRATVASLGRMPWATGSVALDAAFVRAQFEQTRPWLGRVLEVKLEDLLRDPRVTMAAVLRFVGEPWDDAVLDHVSRGDRDEVAPLPWFATAVREPATRPAGGDGALEALGPAGVRLVERVNGDAMARYGYAPARLAREPSARDHASLLAAEAPAAARLAARLAAYRARLVAHMNGRRRFDPQRALEASLGFNPRAWRHYPGFVLPPLPDP